MNVDDENVKLEEKKDDATPLPPNTYIRNPMNNDPDGLDMFPGVPRCLSCGHIYWACIC